MSVTQNLLEDLAITSAGAVSPATARVKAYAWARVSTDMQERRGLSIPEQLREIRLYAEKHDIEIVDEFHESASAFQREGKRVEFHRMLAQVKANKEITAILVHDFSRFSRDSLRAKTLLHELRDSGVRVISLNDPEVDSESVAGVYMEAITFAKNEAFSREIAFHTRKGCRANIQTRDEKTGWCYKNGGQALLGYRLTRFERGVEKHGGRAIIKSIWTLDDTIVAGRKMHEWARHCLVEVAGKGATLDELRDFCNETGIPARRKKYWGISTWHALLQPSILLQYCGYGVWNVHRKNGTVRPASEWVIVENAHPAIITEDEAKIIAAARREQSRERRFDTGYRRSRTSPYILSGGLFKCGRCGSNMIGFRTNSGRYYLCGSNPYRRGMGCGPGIYIRKDEIEAEVIEGLTKLLDACADPEGFTQRVNEELRKLWRESSGYDPNAVKRTAEIDGKIANIRKAIEDGLSDATWANERLKSLAAEREQVSAKLTVSGEAPQIDVATAMSYRRDTGKILASGDFALTKRLLRTAVEEIKLAPEKREVEITYRVPEPVMLSMVAGAGFEPAAFGL